MILEVGSIGGAYWVRVDWPRSRYRAWCWQHLGEEDPDIWEQRDDYIWFRNPNHQIMFLLRWR